MDDIKTAIVGTETRSEMKKWKFNLLSIAEINAIIAEKWCAD